jgi:ankyrin repeat protein
MILIDAGANVHLVNSAARSALHFAASNGCNTTLRALLGKGVDVNKQVYPLKDFIILLRKHFSYIILHFLLYYTIFRYRWPCG